MLLLLAHPRIENTILNESLCHLERRKSPLLPLTSSYILPPMLPSNNVFKSINKTQDFLLLPLVNIYCFCFLVLIIDMEDTVPDSDMSVCNLSSQIGNMG